MYENEVQKLNDLTRFFRKINGKIKLISLLNKAKVEYDQNNYETCAETCSKILKTDPKNAVALRGLGCVMQAKGNYKKAFEYYQKALETSLNKEIEYTLIGTLYYQEDNLEEAIKFYNLAIDVNDDYDSAYEGRNQALLENHIQLLDLQDSLVRQKIF